MTVKMTLSSRETEAEFTKGLAVYVNVEDRTDDSDNAVREVSPDESALASHIQDSSDLSLPPFFHPGFLTSDHSSLVHNMVSMRLDCSPGRGFMLAKKLTLLLSLK